MINHGLSTGALFLIVGCIYERYHTRNIDEIGGLAKPMPWMAFFLVFFTLSSIGLPGLNGFVGEFLVLLGTATSLSIADGRSAGTLGYGYAIPAATGIILSAVYMLWMCQRVLFGPLKAPPNTPDTSAGLSNDLNGREIGILAPIAICCVVLGVFPGPMLDSFNIATKQHILRVSPWDLDYQTDASNDEDAISLTSIPTMLLAANVTKVHSSEKRVAWPSEAPPSMNQISGQAPDQSGFHFARNSDTLDHRNPVERVLLP